MQAWFYELQASGGQLLAEHDYLGSLDSMHLNADWAAAFFEGAVHLLFTQMVEAIYNMKLPVSACLQMWLV